MTEPCPMKNSDKSPPILYGVREAARLLSVSQTTVRTLCTTGRLMSVRLDHRVLIPAIALDEFVDGLLAAAESGGGDVGAAEA